MSNFFDKVSNRFKLGKHYRMERFGISFVSLFALLMVCVIVCFTTSVKKQQSDLKSVAMYTTRFQTSRTRISGTVDGIYKSEDGKSCMVLLKFDDITQISTDAANYQMFLTSANVQGNPFDLQYAPSGSIYMFGSSGYMGIYLYSSTGFEPQILDLVVRCNSELVSVQNASSVGNDASFSKYDQFRIYFNPGAASVTTAACLGKPNFELFDVYEELICRKQEMRLQSILQADLETLRVNLNAISEYENRLGLINIDGLNIIVPERPDGILGDSIEVRDDGQLIYHCVERTPRGVNFNWWDGSIQNGYLDKVVPEGMTYINWLAILNKEPRRFDLSNMKWYLSDGSAWADYESVNDTIGPAKDINNTISLLTEAYRTYYSTKSDYQSSHLRDLLALEFEARNVATNYTINTSENVLRLY